MRLPTAAPCTTQLPMSRQVCAPQFYQRMTARAIFDRCGDRRMNAHSSAISAAHAHEKMHSLKNVLPDRRTMHNPTPHVAPGACTANLSTIYRTVDFRPLRRPTKAHFHFSQPWAPIGTPRHEHDKFHSLETCICRPPRHAKPNSSCRARCVQRNFINE